MLSYQHIYHAGNMADVQKHLWLLSVIEYLTRKDKPFIWVDTHAGRGLYDLDSAEAQKIKEFETGILKYYTALKKAADLPALLQTYIKLISGLNGNTKDAIHTYPGSAYLAAKTMRPTDKLFAYDLHKGEYPHLEKTLKNYINSTTRFEDGFTGLKSFTPPTLRRGGVLIDPSYEMKDEYAKTAQAVVNAYHKWPQGIYMVWYPILDKGLHTELLEPLKALNLPTEDFVIDEWHFGAVERGMKGSGMVIINPPYGCAQAMEAAETALKQLK